MGERATRVAILLINREKGSNKDKKKKADSKSPQKPKQERLNNKKEKQGATNIN